MGVCYSRAGWLGTSTETYTDCSELSTSNSKSLIYESPRWSADTGDKGKLATLFYKRRKRRRYGGNPDLFTARLEGLLGGIQNFQIKHSPGDITFASFVGTPFVRNLEMQGMDALERSYAISAAKASARNTFLLLQERDKSETVEIFAPMIKIQTPGSSSVELEVENRIIIVDDDDDDNDIQVESELEDVAEGVQLDSPEDGANSVVLTESNSPNTVQDEDMRSSEFSESMFEEDIDLGAPYKAGMQKVELRSFFESCFPATGRWASVVSAARQSACLPRINNSPLRQNCTEVCEAAAPPLHELLRFEIRGETSREVVDRLHLSDGYHNYRHTISKGGRFSDSSQTCSNAGHACVRCCGSVASSRYSDSETCSEGGHACIGCCGLKERDAMSLSISTRSRRTEIETGSSSEYQFQQRRDDYSGNVTLMQLVVSPASTSSSHEPPASAEDTEDRIKRDLCVAPMSTPTEGLRVDIPKQQEDAGPFKYSTTPVCTTPEPLVVVEASEPLDRVDSDRDMFFSFPCSPSAKALEELGSGHIFEEMKSAKLMEHRGLRRIADEDDVEGGEEELEGPRSRTESPRGGNALLKGAFGSPFPVLGASGRKTKPVLDKKLKLISLERANSAALAKKHATNSDGVLTSSSDSYMDTSSSSQLSRQRDNHDWDDYSSDLFEIPDMQPVALQSRFPGVNLSCLPIKSSFGCSDEGACKGSSKVESCAPSYNSNALKYQLRGANAMRGADTRAKILREMATRKAKFEQGSVPAAPSSTAKQTSNHQSISVMVLSLLRRRPVDDKHTPGNGCPLSTTKPSLVVGSIRSVNGELKPPHPSFGIDGKFNKSLSIRDVLERQERQRDH